MTTGLGQLNLWFLDPFLFKGSLYAFFHLKHSGFQVLSSAHIVGLSPSFLPGCFLPLNNHFHLLNQVFGADPTGFGCLFIKNTIIQGLHNSDRARGVGMVRIIPSGVSNASVPRVERQRGDQERLPDIHETDAEEYLDAPDYVDPVSAFSGPMAQFYVESVRENAVLERITSASGREMNIAGFDDSSGRTSLPSENEEEWDDRLHGEVHSARTYGGHEDFVSRDADFSGRGTLIFASLLGTFTGKIHVA